MEKPIFTWPAYTHTHHSRVHFFLLENNTGGQWGAKSISLITALMSKFKVEQWVTKAAAGCLSNLC